MCSALLIVLFAGSLENLLHKSINDLARWRVGSRDTGLRSFSFSPPCVTVIKCKTSSGDNVRDVKCRPFVEASWAPIGLANVPLFVLVQMAPEWGLGSSCCVFARGRQQSPLFFLEPQSLGLEWLQHARPGGHRCLQAALLIYTKHHPSSVAGEGLTAGPVQSHSRAPFSGIWSLPQVP